ncbi:unnamed protein product [Aspergillus niger]|nr:hypothetical protein CBS147324_65 [Aspergillus niger]KAI3001773.1 hypothetical protein CBS147345_8549 [Aspergillus niger]SPB47733.1 unnamed protein product [Aspergillus niger]
MDLDFYWTMSIPHGVLGSFPDFSLSTPRLLTIDFSTSSSSASSYFKYLEIRLSASENTPHYAIILRDLQKAASLYSIITSNRHIYLLIVETVHMATNTMPFTCPSMVTRPRTTRPSGSYITWSDVIRSNRSPSPVIRRLRTHPSASTVTTPDSFLFPTPNPPCTLARRGAIRRSVPKPITLYSACPLTKNIPGTDSISTCRKHDSARNHHVSGTRISDAPYFSDISPFSNCSPDTSSPDTSFNTTTTTTTPSSDIFSTNIHSPSDTCPSDITSPDVPSSATAFSSDTSTECNCGSIIFDALDNSLGGTPSITKALETVRLYGGCDGLKRIIDPIEQLSLCKICTKDESLRDFLHLVCNGVIRQYRHFYYALKEHYETVDYRLGLGSSHEREQHDCTFVLYAVQIVRIIASVDRLNRILPEQPLYDEDAWYALANQGEQLVDATGRLREQVVLGDG